MWVFVGMYVCAWVHACMHAAQYFIWLVRVMMSRIRIHTNKYTSRHLTSHSRFNIDFL
jgi:hypothetical protein